MKIIKEKKEARLLIKNGVNKAADMILVSLGPTGRNIGIGRSFQSDEITNDGKTIAESIEFDDETEQFGANRVKEITVDAFDKAQDGTTTATALFKAIFNKGYEKLDVDDTFTKSSLDTIEVFNEITKAGEKVCAELTKMAKPISTKEEIFNVAMASVKVKEFATMISEIYLVIGKDGEITVEEGYLDNEYEITDGLKIEAGFSNEVFANKDDKSFILEKPFILVTNNTLNFANQIAPITQNLFKNKIKEIVIISDNFSKEILDSFVKAKLNNQFNIIPIKTAFFGRKERMEDIACAIGATFYDKDSGLVFEEATEENLGTAKQITITKDKTIIFNPKGNTEARLKSLKAELAKTKTKFDANQLTKRIAELSGGIGVIRIGGDITNKIYLKKKIQNGINTTKHALAEGVVPGAGLALKALSEKMPENILTDCLLAPYNQIQENAGGKLKIGPEVVDAVKTTKSAIESACRIAGLLLTVEYTNVEKREQPKDFAE